MKLLSVILVCLFLFTSPALAGEIKTLHVGDAQPFSSEEDLMKVYFFQVRAQDSTLIVSGGKTMLVDCGHYESGPYIADYLLNLGIESIDYAVNTHPHDDHIDGFKSLFQEIEVGGFYICFPPDVNDEMISAVQTAEAYGVPVIEYDVDTEFPMGDTEIRMFQDSIPDHMNANSMVMHVSLGDCSTVLTADISPAAHKNLAAAWGEDLKCDILKLPHHGLYTPKKIMVTTADPEICVLTNGHNKSTDETIRFVESWRYPIIHTPHGTIECTTNGEYWTLIQHDQVEWDD